MRARTIARYEQIRSTRFPVSGPGTRIGEAVVLGGSVAGLLAARVLSDHADRVTVLDPGDPAATGYRTGAPQGRHLHLLLATGLALVEHWFPGFTGQAVERGACVAPAEVRRTYFGRRLWVGRADTRLLTATRPLLEDLLRERVRALGNVRLLRGRATGLEYADGRVTGAVAVVGGERRSLPADLVVDAMGRASRMAGWLSAGGFDPPVTRRVGTGVNYATALFPRHEAVPATNVVLARFESPRLQAAAVVAVEPDRWMVTLAGGGEHRPGQQAADFLRHCREDLPGEFAAATADGLTTAPQTYRLADNRRRDWTGHGDVPAGLVSVGDAVASFNPIHAQGMTCAALHASCLDRYLRAGADLTRPAAGFYAMQRLVVDAAWAMSTAEEPRTPRPGSRRRPFAALTRRVARELPTAALRSAVVGERFEEVNMMMRHPRALFAPRIVARALVTNRLARRS